MAKSLIALIDGSFAVRMADKDQMCPIFDPMEHYKGGEKFRLDGEVYLVVPKQDVFNVKENCWRFEKITNLQFEYIGAMQGDAQSNGRSLPEFTGTTRGEASDYIRFYEGHQYA